MHLRGTWIEQQGAGRILDVSRAVSNGPTLPLVISPTTLGDKMNVAVTYRLTGFSQAKIDGIMESFVEQLQTLGSQNGRRKHPMVVAPAVQATAEPLREASFAA